MSRISWSDFKTAISEKLHYSLDFSCFLGLLLTKWWWWRQLLKADFQREPVETRGSTLPGQRHSWLPGPTLSHRRGTGRLSQHSAWMMSGLVTPPSYSGWSMIRTASAYLGLKGHFSIYELQPHSYQSLKSCCLNCLKLTWLHHLTQAGQWSWHSDSFSLSRIEMSLFHLWTTISLLSLSVSVTQKLWFELSKVKVRARGISPKCQQKTIKHLNESTIITPTQGPLDNNFLKTHSSPCQNLTQNKLYRNICSRLSFPQHSISALGSESRKP